MNITFISQQHEVHHDIQYIMSLNNQSGAKPTEKCGNEFHDFFFAGT